MSATANTTQQLVHNKVSLALHTLRVGSGTPLLLLHGLGEHSPSTVPEVATRWPGPIYALDFTGHGQSSVPAGGGYSCEILLADVDIALRHLGGACLLGRGIGAYIALLAAGARPELVHGAVLTDGPGLAGGATHISAVTEIATVGDRSGQTPDPWALIELSRDARPANYASTFARLSVTGPNDIDPIAVCCVVRPPWIEAINEEPGVITGLSAQEALESYAAR